VTAGARTAPVAVGDRPAGDDATRVPFFWPWRKSARAIPADSKLRVVHIAKHCGYANGSVHVAVDLACVQVRAGYDVVFVSGGDTSSRCCSSMACVTSQDDRINATR
jgi:hypothetical protein